MKFARIAIIFLLLIISIGVVSAAEEINDNAISNDDSIELEENTLGEADLDETSLGEAALDDASLQSTQNDEYGENEINNTFTDLEKDMNASGNVLNLEHGYKFNNETDKGYVIINNDNFTINGNNNVIDGNNQSTIFTIFGKNVTISNLILANGYCNSGAMLSMDGGGAIKLIGGSVTLMNVTFINNAAIYEGGDIFAYFGQLTCLNCTFTDSCSVNGNSIYSSSSTLDIEDCNFTSKYSSIWSTIRAMGGNVFFNNCYFTNISSVYAPAVSVESGNLFINNTRFRNLKADKTAGAVSTKTCGQTIIANCLFINTSSVKNGGAVYIDVMGDNNPVDDKIVEIINSTFINTRSSFGGAYLQLNGKSIIEDSTFTNCASYYDGGAVYLSCVDADFINCTFNSNNVESHDNYQTFGGAIYFDYGVLNITDSEFNANSAPFGGGILVYDSEYHLDNVTFNNNGNAIYTYFDNESSTIGKIYGNDEISEDDLNNTYYPSVIIGEGMSLNLTTNIIDLTILPNKFDLREIGWITQVRDQGDMGSCWTFGALDALESALLKNTGIKYSFSENNMQDAMVIYSRYGGSGSEGCLETIAAAYLLNWFGIFPEEYDSYDELGKISPLIYANQSIHIQDFAFIERNISTPGDPIIKQAILKYGVLAIVYDARTVSASSIYNFYSPNSTEPDHAVGLVGWDDNYPKENFENNPPDNGAWIIKNSWGTEWGEEGYGYISYYDSSFCPALSVDSLAIAYIIENTVQYNKNYQYDFTGIDHFMAYDENDELYGSQITNVNNFVSEDDDLIAAVGTYFNQSGMDYTVEIAVNGVTVYAQNGVSPYRGYRTIKLNNYIPIKKGDKFSISVTSKEVAMSIPIRVHYEAGVSLTNYNGTWSDIYETYGQIACIKAYTLKDDSVITGNKDVSVDYGSGSYFSVNVATAEGHAVGAGASVMFTINGKNTTVKTDENGIAKFKITDVPGTYEVTTTYNGQTYKNNVTVKLNLNTCKVTANKNIAVDYDGGKYFSVKVVSADGKVFASGATVKFTINGKTTTVKTDQKGIAKVKITDVPNKYTIKTTFNGKTVKNTVTVKQVLKASKVTVKKTAKSFVLKATLKINGKLVKGKLITFKFNGKTYSVKTNAKGIAQKTLNKAVINKLKKGKTYSVQVTYLKDTIKSSVTVK